MKRKRTKFYPQTIREAYRLIEILRMKGYTEVEARNPKTGEEIPISARRVVTFRPGQKLKARVDTEVPVGACVDYLQSRPDVDPDRIALYGASQFVMGARMLFRS